MSKSFKKNNDYLDDDVDSRQRKKFAKVVRQDKRQRREIDDKSNVKSSYSVKDKVNW
jgi:hypothetical protein